MYTYNIWCVYIYIYIYIYIAKVEKERGGPRTSNYTCTFSNVSFHCGPLVLARTATGTAVWCTVAAALAAHTHTHTQIAGASCQSGRSLRCCCGLYGRVVCVASKRHAVAFRCDALARLERDSQTKCGATGASWLTDGIGLAMTVVLTTAV